MEQRLSPTERLFRPQDGQLLNFKNITNPDELTRKSAKVEHEIKSLIAQKDYPCVAALRSYHKDEYQVGFYGNLGEGKFWKSFRNDLLFFLQEQKKSSSIYLSFWAIFDESPMTESEFEIAMWKELSFLTSKEDKDFDWPKNSVQDPENNGFRFSLGGSEFFVVGLHPGSSRKARQFSSPVLIFNVFNQFDQLMKLQQYAPMVKVNRQRDLKFQGSVNPMVEKHGENWEAIQFSGRENDSAWKCPFSFLLRSLKP